MRGGPRPLDTYVKYAGVVPVSVHVVSGGGGGGHVGGAEVEWRPLTRLLCNHGTSSSPSPASSSSGGLSGRGVALREGGAVLCFADGTLEALGVDAVAFDPLAAAAAEVNEREKTKAKANANAKAKAKAKAKLRRTLLFAGASVFSGGTVSELEFV